MDLTGILPANLNDVIATDDGTKIWQYVPSTYSPVDGDPAPVGKWVLTFDFSGSGGGGGGTGADFDYQFKDGKVITTTTDAPVVDPITGKKVVKVTPSLDFGRAQKAIEDV